MAETRKQDEQDEQDQDASHDLPDNQGVGDEVDIGTDIDGEDLMSLSMSTTLTRSFTNGTRTHARFICISTALHLYLCVHNVASFQSHSLRMPSCICCSKSRPSCHSEIYQGVIERDPAFLCLYGLSLVEPLRSPRRTP